MTSVEALARCFRILIANTGARRATAFLSARCTVKVTRQYQFNRRATTETFLVTIGRPNYRERAYIKGLQASGEPFPVRRMQLTFWPRSRKGAAHRG